MSNTIDNSYLNKYNTTDYSSLFNSLPKTKESSGGGLVNLAVYVIHRINHRVIRRNKILDCL